MKILNQSFSQLVACVTLLLALGSCSGGGSSGGDPSTSPAPAAGSVTITGTVSGTVIKVVSADNRNLLISEADTGSLPGPPPFPFTLSSIPVGVPVKVFFFSAGQTFPLYIGNTNVFRVLTAGPLDLGFVTMGGGKSTSPANQPPAGTIQLELEGSPFPPQSIIPLTSSISVTDPNDGAQVQGPHVPIGFSLQNFTIGNQNQAHLHVYLDNDQTPYEFLNGAPVLHNGGPALNAQWVSGTRIRFLSLPTNTHTVQFRLSSASHMEYVNQEGSTAVQFTVNLPPSTPPTINVTNPVDNQTLPSGPMTVAFNVTNFGIQEQGQSQLHFYVDGNRGNLYQFLNGSNQVLLNGNPTADVQWVSNLSFRFTALSTGSHSLQLVLADGDAANTELTNSSATDIVNFMVDAPAVASVAVTSGTSFLSSPVRITFSVTDFTIGLPGTRHLRFSIDSGPLNDFYNGTGINLDNGVLLNGVHTHFVHWTSTTSFDLFGLAAGPHQIRLVLVDENNQALANVGASTTQDFTVQQPPTGELQLQPVLEGLAFPVGLSLAPDGRIFYNELEAGRIRIINPSWKLSLTPFCQIPVAVLGGEQGLLGLTLDPNFSDNRYVYVYYTAPGATMNRVARYTESNGVCTDETIILDRLPVSETHNGGIIKFGPDGTLYVVIGDARNPSNAQDLTSLAGKILRVNADGSAPSDNPFISNADANAKKVFSYGHRNSYGFTFHPQTHDLWESENGPNDNDEINRIIAGGNYGWDSNERGGILNDRCCIDPLLAFNPVIAPTGIIAIPGGSSVYPPVYRNNLFVAVWIDGTIRHVILSGANLDQFGGSNVAYTGGAGGLLSLMLGADGYVYASNANGIFRLTPH